MSLELTEVISVIVCSLNRECETIKYVPQNVETIIANSPGRSKARNEAAKKATGDILLFLDGDLQFDPQLILHYSKLIDDKTVISYPSFIFCTRFCGITRENFQSMNGFDEEFEIGEDLEFGLRALKYGLKIQYVDSHKIRHLSHPRCGFRFIQYIIAEMKILFKYKVFIARNRIETINPLSAFWFLITFGKKALPLVCKVAKRPWTKVAKLQKVERHDYA